MVMSGGCGTSMRVLVDMGICALRKELVGMLLLCPMFTGDMLVPVADVTRFLATPLCSKMLMEKL